MFLPATLVVVTLLLILATALLTMVMANLKRSNLYSRQISATNIAEAGINYYLWHLAHNPNDYTDGNPESVLTDDGYYGPFHHEYKNSLDQSVGSYDLYIYPPNINSSTINIRSIGQVNGSNLNKSILTKLAMPYFSSFFLLSFNDETWIGSTEAVNGPVHINNPLVGIRNDGSAGRVTATCVDHYTSRMFGGSKDCVWGSGQFTDGYQYPANPFNLADVNFSDLQTASGQTGNIFYPESTAGNNGYHLILKETGYDLKYVKTMTNHSGYSPEDLAHKENFPDEIKSESSTFVAQNQSYPDNGLLFFEDNVWVEGTIRDHKITIVAAKPTENRTNFMKNIYVINNIAYAEKNQTTKIGLISQRRIVVSYIAPNNLSIDAAMLTKNSYVFFPYYSGNIKTSLNVFGSLAHLGGLIFSWNEPVNSGYRNTNYDHDSDLIFAPPPYFPKSGSYQIVSWQEDPNF